MYQLPASVYVQCDAGIAIAQPMPLDSHGNFYPVFPGMPAFAPGSSSGSAQLMHGSVADPNGTVFPDDLNADAYYSQDVAGNDNVQFWRWSIADQEWKEITVT